MIVQSSIESLESGLDALSRFRETGEVRGRFVAMYLGLRLMGESIAPLGSTSYTSVRTVEDFLDHMWTKTHKLSPRVVLTAPFGGGGPGGGYSTVTGDRAPGNETATNIWRNNFGVQKGVGCVGDEGLIESLLETSGVRASCPHLSAEGDSGVLYCGLTEARPTYRGEDHTIWLRKTAEGLQVVDLNQDSTYRDYLLPNGRKIPVFALMAVLYCLAPAGVYPNRELVGIPDFASDFGFPLDRLEEIFDCDPESSLNRLVLESGGQVSEAVATSESRTNGGGQGGGAVPLEAQAIASNSGLQAEIMVARLLTERGWTVSYTGNQRLAGYDLLAVRGPDVMRVEVKSSVGFTRPILTESEWFAAQSFADSYCLAIVDFVGSDEPDVWIILNPGETLQPVSSPVMQFRLRRSELDVLRTEIDFI